MDANTACYFRVFGMEEGCGGEAQLIDAVRTLPGVEQADWHSPSHGICVQLREPANRKSVTARVRSLGYQISATQTNCPCRTG